MYNLFPFDLPLSSLLGYNMGFVPPKEELNIIDPSYDIMSKYGEPSENWTNIPGGPYWSKLQAWEMWLHKPEPLIAVLDPRLGYLIQGQPKPEPKKEYKSLLDLVRKLKL